MPETRIHDLTEFLWAKTLNDGATGELVGWLPLLVHLHDTAEVARLLYRHRKSRQHRAVLESAFPPDFDVESLVWLLGALHDIGKAGPNFQKQHRERANWLYLRSSELTEDHTLTLNVDHAQPINSQAEFPHSLASEIIVARVLGDDFGLSRQGGSGPAITIGRQPKSASRRLPLPIAHQFASILGAHHGMTANGQTAATFIRAPRWTNLLGLESSAWPKVQREIATTLISESGIDFSATFWHDESFNLDRGTLSLLSSLVVEADWVASDNANFPLIEPDDDINACAPSSVRAAQGWESLQFPSLWDPAPETTAEIAVHSRFDLPASATIRSGQRSAFAATANRAEPAVVVVESETGSGKTETGLLVAENLARATGASGVFFGLPTQATANGMFPRFGAWISRLVSTAEESGVAVSLAHGKAGLNADFHSMPRMDGHRRRSSRSAGLGAGLNAGLRADLGGEHTASGIIGVRLGNGLPDDSLVADDDRTNVTRAARRVAPGTHSWLSGRKKRLLSDFVIGTVDQLLMAALRSRHLMLRHSGLADKVVIIDEAHAADSTMRLFLGEALVWLGRWGVPVVILTATLPPGQKRALIDAYQRGLSMRAERAFGNGHAVPTGRHGSAAEAGDSQPTDAPTTPADGPEPAPTDQPGPAPVGDPAEAITYPALTVATADSIEVTPIAAEATKSVDVRELSDDDEDILVHELRELGRDGGCIVVIRNSVRRVQATAARLRDEFGDAVVTASHARFAASDRAENDRHLLAAYGKSSETRPDFSIVVASQVVEQSLDIDFDVMITDMCPIDLLIQRIGRLHRHSDRTRPTPLARPLCLITGISDDEDGVPQFSQDAEFIYGRHLLLRSLAALRTLCPDGTLTSPNDVAPLVHAVYGEQSLGPEDWQDSMREAAELANRKETDARELARRWVTEPTDDIHGLDDWLNDGDGDPEDTDPYNRERGRVRDGSESIEVLLVLTDGTGWRTLDWLPKHGGSPIPIEAEVPRHIAEAVANSSIRLPFGMSQGATGDAVVAELEKLGVPSWQRSPLLRGQLVLPLSARPSPGADIDDFPPVDRSPGGPSETYEARVGRWTVVYDRDLGLRADRLGDPP